MRNIALVLTVVLCLVTLNTEQKSVAVNQQANIADCSELQLAQTVLHEYSNLSTVNTCSQNSSGSILTIRIPHKKGSTRHHTWLTMHPTAPACTKPKFHGGQLSPKAVTQRQMPTALSRLCRLII